MSQQLIKNRIASIDLLKGIVMVVMALDHIRDYFHAPAFFYDPTDPLKTSLPIFFTRWITHYCAPTFCFLAGVSAFLISRRKTLSELSGFLWKRGLWLVIIELTVVNFAWYFDIHYSSPTIAVIWSLGISMIVLSAIIHLPRKAIFIFSLVLIAGHNLLDSFNFNDSIAWSILHHEMFYNFANGGKFYVVYPIIPWIAVMSMGYWFGSFYNSSYDNGKRKKLFNTIGIACIALFFIIRGINIYGDLTPWVHYATFRQSAMSFLNPSKYPPSLCYLLMTLGPSLIFLANSESLKGRIVNFFSTFGRVPFFYYIIHLYVIHVIAMIATQLTGYGYKVMFLSDWVGNIPQLKGYGFSLWIVYAIWIGIIALLYPVCKKFDAYKLNNKDKWWLSYF